jgi:phage shock protein A
MYKASNNSSELESMLKKKVSKISTSMNLYKNNKNCTEVSEMLTEAIDKISQFDASNINEESVYEVMRYFDLVEDLEKVSDGEGE